MDDNVLESKIASTADQYRALKIVLKGMSEDEKDAPNALLDRESCLIQRLIAAPASSGVELSHKASVLLDWVSDEDTAGKLTVSLCRDTTRVFPLGKTTLRDEPA